MPNAKASKHQKRKPSFRSKGRSNRPDEAKDQLKSETNDPDWYSRVPGLLENAANIPFSYATGIPLNLDWGWGSSITSDPMIIPGIATLSLLPTVGEASNPNSAVNVAATSMYSFVRHANSGRSNYDSPDLMLYCLTLGQVYSYINWLFRIYGCANLYSYQNRFLPRGLVEAQGVDFDNVIENLANFRYGINALIHKAASLACPADMPYFRRLAFLFQNVYAEGETAKSQLYMFVPHAFFQYNETTEETGGKLQIKAFPTGKLTVTKLLTYGSQLLDPILSSEDMNIMSGDILKAYTADKILKLSTIPEVYIITPVTDLAVLEQFQNAQFTVIPPTRAEIKQDVDRNCIVSDITWVTNAQGFPTYIAGITTNHILNTILVDPKPADIIERTRLMLTASYTDGDTLDFQFSAGTEVPISFKLWYYDASAVLQSRELNIIQNTDSLAAAQQVALDHIMLECFKFHPGIYIVNGGRFRGCALDYDNYTVVSERQLERMNEAALLSLFDVSSIARF